MSINVTALKDSVRTRHLPFQGTLGQLQQTLQREDQQEFYRELEALAELVGEMGNQIESLRQQCLFVSQLSKESFLQQLAEAPPEDILDLYRYVKAQAQAFPEIISMLQHFLNELHSRAESDPRIYEVFPPRRIELMKNGVETYQLYHQNNMRNLSWIEEYMRGVVTQAVLPHWVGIVSIGADSSDHHLG